MRRFILTLACLALAGCAAQAPRPKGPVVGVEHFTVDRPNADGSDAKIADQAAVLFVWALINAGVDAYLVPPGGASYGDVRITGAISQLDFGSRDSFGIVITARDAAGRELTRVSAARSSYSMKKAVKVVMTEDLLAKQELRHAVFSMPAAQ